MSNDLRTYQDTPLEELSIAMQGAGARGRMVSNEARFYIDWAGGCHVTSPSTGNDPPLAVRTNSVSGKTGAYYYACEREALDTVDALLNWTPARNSARTPARNGEPKEKTRQTTPRHTPARRRRSNPRRHLPPVPGAFLRQEQALRALPEPEPTGQVHPTAKRPGTRKKPANRQLSTISKEKP